MAENNSPPPLMTDKELLMETGAFNEIMNAAFEYADAYCASGDEPRRYSAAIDHLRKTVRAEITKFSRADYKTNASTEFDAQAAPAAVAVPNTCRDTFRFGGRCEKHICPKPCQQCAALAANPEATEDSSAGDLAEASHQTKLLAQALGDCILASGIVRSDLDMSGPQLLMFAEDLKELLLAGQAEVQAEPVAWANWKVGSTSYVPYRTRTQAQASVSQSAIAATQEGPYEVVPLYTAPQAQPADAPYPPLPATEVLDSYVSQRTGAEVYVDGYTADQMHAYIDLDRAAMAAAQEGGAQ